MAQTPGLGHIDPDYGDILEKKKRMDEANPKTGYPAGQGHGRHKNMEHPSPDAVKSGDTEAPAA